MSVRVSSNARSALAQWLRAAEEPEPAGVHDHVLTRGLQATSALHPAAPTAAPGCAPAHETASRAPTRAARRPAAAATPWAALEDRVGVLGHRQLDHRLRGHYETSPQVARRDRRSPVGSASTSSAGRGQPKTNPKAVVVTPGEPDADANTIMLIASPVPRIQDDRDLAGRGHRRELRRIGARDVDRDDRLCALARRVLPSRGADHHGRHRHRLGRCVRHTLLTRGRHDPDPVPRHQLRAGHHRRQHAHPDQRMTLLRQHLVGGRVAGQQGPGRDVQRGALADQVSRSLAAPASARGPLRSGPSSADPG
jgi:hypothetical protein